MSDDRPYLTATQITPGAPIKAGRAVWIDFVTAGVQMLKLQGGDAFPVRASQPGPVLLDNLGVTDAPAAGTTATATVFALY